MGRRKTDDRDSHCSLHDEGSSALMASERPVVRGRFFNTVEPGPMKPGLREGDDGQGRLIAAARGSLFGES